MGVWRGGRGRRRRIGMRTSHDTRVVKRAVAMRMRKFMILDGGLIDGLIDESMNQFDVQTGKQIFQCRWFFYGQQKHVYISLLLLLSLSLFISLFLSIFLSFCNIFGMLRMYSDSICYESPEVACNTGAGTSLRVPGKISVPIAAKHIHLLALLSSLSFTIKSSTLFNLPQTTIITQQKLSKPSDF